MNNYFKKIDKIIMTNFYNLIWEVKNLALVLSFVPLHMCWLCIKIMFPWLIPFITKEES